MTQPVVREGANSWIVGTRKGAWTLRRTGPGPLDWTAGEPWFFGCQVHHVVQDPRGAGTLLAAVLIARQKLPASEDEALAVHTPAPVAAE